MRRATDSSFLRSNAARDDFQLGWDGSFGIQGQDHDDGTGQPATQKITIPGINIAGQGNLQATIAVGALDSEPAFNNFEAADGDQIEIYANVDGGGRTLIGRFAPPADGVGDLYLDTDLDGIGDGPNLTVELQDFSFAIPSSGSSLDLEIELTSTDSFESLALDNVRVEVPKLLLTELVVTPTGGEFIEIHNPDGVTVDLSDYYVTDATFAGGGTFYYNIVTGSNAGGGSFSDFLARFPAGATIAPGEYQTIALNGSDNFNTEYGVDPTYELYEDGGAADAIPDMREGLVGSINDQGGLTNGGEVVVFFQWDGNSDLVIDVDYALWGDKDEAIDKSGVAIDGPDGGTATSSYQNDTAIASQDVIDTGAHAGGQSWQRIDLTEGAQITTGGNGIAGNDETSEDLSNTWAAFTPTPNAGFTADNGLPPVFEQTGPFALSAHAPAGTVVGDVDANDGDGADIGVTYTLIGDQMMVGQNGFNVTPILTVGDTLAGTSGALNASTAGDYQPVGILDGLGAYELDANTVRVFVNHELTSSAGATYGLANGSTLTGARISYLDIDKSTRQIVDGGLAYDTIINAAGVPVDDINKADIGSGGGLARLCSAQLVHGGTFGFVDTIFFSGEEDSAANGGLGGLEYGLDAATGTLYALPAMGYAAWENVTPLETGDANTIALLVGDDRAGAPLYLYVGNKGLDANGAAANDFMSRNGLANGTLYHWKADNGDTTPEQFNGTGGSRTGTWVALTDLSSIAAQDAGVATNGGFTFSRPEDVTTDPNNPTRAAFSSTGRGGLFPSDNWGTLYIADVTFAAGGVPTTGNIEILYDADDAGGGQFAGPDFGLRSPDNLDWADDGLIYAQEDRSTSPASAFGGVSGQEASIWQLNPTDGSIRRVGQIDRTAVLPVGSTDSAPADLGNWESSGVLDVSSLFGEAPGSLLIFDVQAHAITDGEIGANQLVEGGQLAFLEMGVETAGTFRINPNTGVITTTSAGVFSGSESVDLTVLADDGFDTDTATVTVNVNSDPVTPSDQIRFATFNTSLSGPDLPAQLSTPDDFNAQRIAEIIQRSNPDVILLNEFNFDPAGVSADLFRENYLEISQNGADPVYYPYVFNAPSNTGIDSGFDLDNDGATGGDGDAFGFGSFDGQFGMLFLSKYPILEGEVRTFQQFLWKDMPGAMLPADPLDTDGNGDFANWYTAAELDVVRLSSKSHWDVPIDFNGETIHALTSHPTPPVFDGPEDRNGTRNHDEIRFWADYITPGASGYIYDDVEFAAAGFSTPGSPNGGLAPGESFVILGDMNADPFDGDSTGNPVSLLLGSPQINTSDTPDSLGGPEDAVNDGADNNTHIGNPSFDTSDFSEPPGNLRVDYVLPSANLDILDAEVFWPVLADPLSALVTATDHRLTWVDLQPQPVVSGPFTLQILHASDLEGGVSAIDDAPNFAAVVEALENDAENNLGIPSILLSAGDTYLPGPFFNAAGDPSLRGTLQTVYQDHFGEPGLTNIRESVGRVDISIMNVLGFDASALGNHEFDAGTGIIGEIIGTDIRGPNLSDVRWLGAQFPYLSANLDFSNDGNLSGLFTDQLLPNTDFQSLPSDLTAAAAAPKIAPFTTIEVDGELIGVVAATTPLLEQISSPHPTVVKDPGAGTNNLDDLASVLQPAIDIIAGAGIDKIILVSHLQQIQLEQELIPKLRGIDIAIAGGSDTLLADDNDRLRVGDVAQGPYPILTSDLAGDPAVIVSTDGEYSYVGRLVVTFLPGGIIDVSSVMPEMAAEPNVSGAYPTDEQGVLDLWGNLDDPFAQGTKGAAVKQLTDAVSQVVNEKDGLIFGKTSVFLEGRRSAVRTEETNLGNLTADANLAVAQRIDANVVVSIKNGGGIRAEIGEIDGITGELLPPQANPQSGKKEMEISQLDIENSLRFNNGLTLLTVTATELKNILEHAVAPSAPGATPGQFAQIGGMSFSFDPRQQAIAFDSDTGDIITKGKRVESLAILDEHGGIADVIVEKGKVVGDPDRPIRIVTLNFLADGGDAYPFPQFGEDRVDLAIDGEQQALAEYLKAFYDIGPYSQTETPATEDTRIQNLALRGDTVLNPEKNLHLTAIGTFATGIFDQSGAEIVAHDPASQRLFFSNVADNALGVVDISDPTNPTLVNTIDLSPFGDRVNSVAVRPGNGGGSALIAAAVQAEQGAENGMVVFFDPNGNFINSVEVGVLPDMVTFTRDGNNVLVANEGEPAGPFNDPMMTGLNGFDVTTLFTVGESINGTTGALNSTTAGAYTPVGILDGLGAYRLNPATVRVFANHELTSGAGAAYKLANGSSLTGARISYFDIGVGSRQLVDAGLAFNTIINAAGSEVTDANKASLGNGGGIARFCSGILVEGGDDFGFVDTIYFAGEEDDGSNGGLGGLEYGLDVLNGVLYALPSLGYAAWENVTPIDTQDDGTIGLLIGDDRAGAPLYLWVGNKGLDAAGNPSQDFVSRNGLANGTLYHWTSDNGDTTPQQFNGTGASRTGTWVALTDLSSIAAQDAEVATNGGFNFSRPEDVATDPNDGTRAVFSSTGRGQLFPADNWGTTYLVDITFGPGGVPTAGEISILYDGDDAGGGQFAGPDFGLRSPDNVDWADDGLIYIQEDRSTSPSSAFGGTSGEEASIWQLDPDTGTLTRVGQIDRTAVPPGSSDGSPGDIGNWESSGILDVSALFGEPVGSLLLFDVQAHAIRDGIIGGSDSLVEGGQLAFLQSAAPAPLAVVTNIAPVFPPMTVGLHGWNAEALLTVGQTLSGTSGDLNPTTAGDYTPAGVLDGLGAYELDAHTVRVFANHELQNNRGYDYEVSDGGGGTFTLDGSRISYFDIDKGTREIVDAGIAYDTIYDATGSVATDNSFLANDFPGFSRFCSSALFEPYQFGSGRGLVNRIYFTGEEDGGGFNGVGGAEWALDPATGDLWQVPALGRGAWENITQVDTGTTTHVAFILSDDTSPFNADGQAGNEAAPLFLYVGEKDPGGDFLAQNGLRDGKLYVWVSDTGDATPLDFNGPGATRFGSWVEIDNTPTGTPSEDGSTGFDEFGYPTQRNLWTQAKAAGSFGFSRPEDVSTNPANGAEIVLASTGVDTYAIDPSTGDGADTFGTLYTITTDFSDIDNPTAKVTILYDGDADAMRALRSPDNLDWADDGFIYAQEDKAETDTLATMEPLFGPGAANPNEAGIVKIDPATGAVTRIAVIDRSVVLDPSIATPTDAVDTDAGTAGEWESSGIIDVSKLFGEAPGTLFLFDVQAHGIAGQDGFNATSRINNEDLVEGGQLLFLQAPEAQRDVFRFTDPPGSVSIIDVSNGAANATVETIGFESFDGRENELRNRGIRVFPGRSASRDLEPEYISVSPDGTQAFVSLQEANAFAVIDISSAELVDILPVGVKDHSRGLPSVDTFQLPEIPIANGNAIPLTTPTGQRVQLGGFSGLHFVGQEGDVLRFVTVPDRGPNPNTYTDPNTGLTNRPFALPDYQARIVEFEVNIWTGETAFVDQIFLTQPDGTTPITGLSNFVLDINGNQVDENPVDTLGNQLPLDPLGGDLEGIVIDPDDGSFWMVDEYRPAIYHFDSSGVLIDRFIPEGTAALAGEPLGTFGTETIPTDYLTRRSNRGFEAVALDAAGDRLYAFIQTPLANPNTAASNASDVIRILEIDTNTGKPIGEYVYLLEDPASGARPGGRVDKIGDAVYLGNGRLNVIERDASVGVEANKFLFNVDITYATNVLGKDFGDKTLEQQTADSLAAIGIRPVNKIKIANLPSIGYAAGDKAEGLTLLPDGSLAVLNDNDFQLADTDIFDGDGNPLFGGGIVFQAEPTISTLGIIKFHQPNGLDGSDRDDAINIQQYPVFGARMPDAITSFEIDGRTYYLSANEGDDRGDLGDGGEVADLGDLPLNPLYFPNADELQQNSVLGRLAASSIDGDLNGDGIYEQLFVYGGRSFTIFDEFGNIIFDSGQQFEDFTAARLPDFFNASNSNNNFDNRSDNKGPEPEAITTGQFNGRTYAFIGLERIGGVMVYDVTTPAMPFFVQYLNNRDFNSDPESGNAGDLGPEELKFIAPEDSPNGKALLVSSNEVSGTVTIFQLDDPTLKIQNEAGANRLTLRRNGENVELVNDRTGELLVNQPLAATHSIEILGRERKTDVFTIDLFSGGNFHLPGGVKFDGQRGNDQIFVLGTQDADMIDVSGNHLKANLLDTKIVTRVRVVDLRTRMGDDLVGITNESILGIAGDPLNAVKVRVVDGIGNEHYVLSQSGSVIEVRDLSGEGDTLDLSKAEQAITVDLGRSRNTLGETDIRLVASGNPFENVIGTQFDDRIIGNNRDNILRGGGGNDSIKSKQGDDILLGDEGDDTLLGSRGNDILIGGLGSDYLRGARNSDLLIGGRTVYDRDDAALRAILDEWQRTDVSYLDRIDLVRNGTPPLTNIADLVFDDLEVDTLDGRTQLDWYFEGLGDDLIPDPVPQLADDEVIEVL